MGGGVLATRREKRVSKNKETLLSKACCCETRGSILGKKRGGRVQEHRLIVHIVVRLIRGHFARAERGGLSEGFQLPKKGWGPDQTGPF